MANKIINVRVLQHDTEDQIRIGASFPVPDNALDKVAENTINQYSKDLEWCGGFKAGCEKYYKRIALVDADTLQVITVIYPVK